MSHQQPQPAAPGRAGVRPTRSVLFWAAPIGISLAVLSALAALYLGGILNPTTNLRHFPIAIVNEDAGPTGKQVVNGLVSGFDKDKFDVRILTREEVRNQLDTAQIYGALGISPTFSSTLQSLARSATSPEPIKRPVIEILANPRAGTMGANIASQALNRSATAVNRRIGQRLLEDIAVHTQGAPMASAVAIALANPIAIESQTYKPLPDGTGSGLSAFYYSLLLLLAGFTGSIVISTLVDSMLGYAPAEFGPVYRFAAQVKISRFRTLLIKWAVTVVVALLTSAAYLAIAKGLGMPFQHGLMLWLYGVFAIAAVGITSTSLIAALGVLGLLVSMFVFVILGLPSAGATVPLEAAPSFFTWLAKFEPMHHVFLGTRALLYLDGRADAGLSQSLTLTAIGLVIGILLGAIVTRVYDRRGYHRVSAIAEPEEATEAPSTTELADTTAQTEAAELTNDTETTSAGAKVPSAAELNAE